MGTPNPDLYPYSYPAGTPTRAVPYPRFLHPPLIVLNVPAIPLLIFPLIPSVSIPSLCCFLSSSFPCVLASPPAFLLLPLLCIQLASHSHPPSCCACCPTAGCLSADLVYSPCFVSSPSILLYPSSQPSQCLTPQVLESKGSLNTLYPMTLEGVIIVPKS